MQKFLHYDQKICLKTTFRGSVPEEFSRECVHKTTYADEYAANILWLCQFLPNPFRITAKLILWALSGSSIN